MDKTCSAVSLEDLPAAAKNIVADGGYQFCKISLEGTNFFILHQTKGGVGRERLVAAVQKNWPEFFRLLQVKLPDSVIADVNAPIGGGPMGNFAVGIYSSDSISKDIAKYIEEITGWPSEGSTTAYIIKHYSGFSDPTQAYVDDIVAHELGHLLFGFGRTRVQSIDYNNSWFALGLGIVYDRMVWQKNYAKPSPLFEAILALWRNRFSKEEKLDQRLINPDESNDGKFGLHRTQIYAHGKAWIFLRKLREKIPEFDAVTKAYVTRPIGSGITYDDFLGGFKNRAAIESVEKEFLVR